MRTGFFEREQIGRVLADLPAAIRPAVQFAHITGWRIPSEVGKAPVAAHRLRSSRRPPGPAHDEERRGPNLPVHRRARAAPEAQKAEHERLKAEGVICPRVSNRSNRKVKGKRITTFVKAFRAACTKAGCPGRIPHDLRADRRAQSGARRRFRARGHAEVAAPGIGHSPDQSGSEWPKRSSRSCNSVRLGSSFHRQESVSDSWRDYGPKQIVQRRRCCPVIGLAPDRA